MATATKPACTIGDHTVEYDPSEDNGRYPWLVLDHDLDIIDQFETEAEALKDAQERHDEDQATGLRELISETIDELDLAALNKLARFLKTIV